jgi:YjbE family integral membrane protein
MDFLTHFDWAAILKIIGIDIMLGVDNAIVIALACAALPKEVRGKAIMWGTAGAVALRAILLVFAGFLMAIPYVKLVAGAYLLFLGYKLLVENEGEHNVPAADRVFTAVKTIIVADFMMSLDNVLAVTAAANTAGAHSTMYAIAGIVLSIPVIIFGASGLTGLMSKFPVIIWFGAGLLGWVGAEMIISDHLVAPTIDGLHGIAGHYTHLCFKAAGFLAVIAAVNVHKLLTKGSTKPAAAVAE